MQCNHFCSYGNLPYNAVTIVTPAHRPTGTAQLDSSFLASEVGATDGYSCCVSCWLLNVFVKIVTYPASYVPEPRYVPWHCLRKIGDQQQLQLQQIQTYNMRPRAR
jgi:hypothetical protein